MKRLTFQDAVRAVGGPVAAALRPGKRAMARSHAACLTCGAASRFTGSVELDAALKPTFPNAPRWDYGVGSSLAGRPDVALWVEVHPASEGEVDTVLKKLCWLQDWQRRHAPDLEHLTARPDGARVFYWVATESGVSITARSRKARLLFEAGLDLPRRRWHVG